MRRAVILTFIFLPIWRASGRCDLKLTFEYNNKSYSVESKIIDGFTYFNSNELQSAIGFEIVTNPITKGIILKYQNKVVTLYADNNWIVLDSEEVQPQIINIPIPAKIHKDKLWLPLPLVNEVLGYFLELNVKLEDKKLVPYEIKFRIKKIVIDPGHGGKDPGAVGPTGLYEKDVVLEIAKLTAELIETQVGIKCVLTRSEDVFIPLGRRAKIANQEKADLFISIHCNAHKRPEKEGTEVYFLSPAKTTWARAVEARENAALKYETEEERGEIESILWDLAQTEFLKESNILSAKLVSSISTAIHSNNRGVKQANFYVLRGAYMPACLLEIEFISSPKWERKLKTKNYQLKIAQGIAKGLAEFKEWYELQMSYSLGVRE